MASRMDTVDDPDYIVQGMYSDGRICEQFGFDDEDQAVRAAKHLRWEARFEGEHTRVITRDGELVYSSPGYVPNRLPPRPPMRQHSAHTPSLRSSSAPRESSLERVRRIAREHERPFDPSKRGTWQGSSRDLVVNPSKRFKQAREGRVDRDSDSPEDEFLVIEEDRGNGTLEWVLVNPLDYPRTKHAREQLFAFGFGAYGATRLLLWSRSIEAALEEAAGWLEQYAPGHLTSEEDVGKLMAEVREDEPDLEDDEAYEKATADLTYTESGYLMSHEWTVDDVPQGEELYKLTHQASREEYESEYGPQSE